MGFLSSIIGGVVKVAVSPIAVVKDVVDVAQGKDADNTRDLIESASDDFEDAIDEIC